MAAGEQQSPVEFTRDDVRRRIRVTARGPLRAEDIAAVVERQLQEGAWSFGMIYDLRAIHEAIPRADALLVAELVRRHVESHGPRGPVAIVTRDARMVGIGQNYADQGAKAGLQVQVFWDLPDAEEWMARQVQGADPTPGPK